MVKNKTYSNVNDVVEEPYWPNFYKMPAGNELDWSYVNGNKKARLVFQSSLRKTFLRGIAL